nr:uncharacterized protein LOC111421778 [Onthophagus taurus]
MRAKQFHLLLNQQQNDNVQTFCFDLQQVQVLPKLPIQEAFYSLQVPYYAFCIVDPISLHPVFYNWTEEENLCGRGSNATGSAIFHFLKNQDFTGIEKIRFFSDGCGGQNKNSQIIHLLMYWLYKEAPASVTSIDHFFPVTGHSYLPADRVFGRVEKQLRRKPECILPEDYENVYKTVGTVNVLQRNWIAYDIKVLLDTFKKIEGISEQKRMYIRKRTKNGETMANIAKTWTKRKTRNFTAA